MTDRLRVTPHGSHVLAWHVHSRNSADALELATKRAKEDGWVIRSVDHVVYGGASIWVVWLVVRDREAPVG